MTGVVDKTTEIDRWLPQIQCTKCGYPRCREYAEAIDLGESNFNRCPPGGEATLKGLAALLGRDPLPLDPDCGTHTNGRRAVIRESLCIGCKLCIRACPVDAIIGTAKMMHTVIPELCTGCELCLAPCPMDCIDMRDAPGPSPTDSPWRYLSRSEVNSARERCERHFTRPALPRFVSKSRQPSRASEQPSGSAIRDDIETIVSRTRARRSQ